MTERRRIGYAKMGRSMSLNIARGDMAGNAEAYNVLVRLARRNPDVDWYIVGKNNGDSNPPLPPNVINIWPAGVSKAPWAYGPDGYKCAFCHTPAPSPKTAVLDCCDKQRELLSLEDYAKAVMSQMDALLVHIGQHGIVHSPIPTSKTTWAEGDFATSYAWARNYGHYLIQGMNAYCDKYDGAKGRVVLLEPDPRNYIKSRDLKWPTGATDDEPVLSQYRHHRRAKHERYHDLRSPQSLGFKGEFAVENEKWHVNHAYDYAGLEMAILPEDWDSWGETSFEDRIDIMVATTASWHKYAHLRRSAMVNEWLRSLFPDAPVYGKWPARPLAELIGAPIIENNPLDFPRLLASARVTLSLPPSSVLNDGLRWCVAKPYQCFAARTVCFFVPPVDAQGWVIPNIERVDGSKQVAQGLYSVRDDWTENELMLARWLRVRHAEELKVRTQEIVGNKSNWEWMTETQRSLLQRRWDEKLLETTIEKRLGL